MQCYVDDANAGGGICLAAAGRWLPLVLHVEDDTSRLDAARAGVAKLIQEHHADLLIGPYGSGLTRAAAEIAEAREVVLWNHSGSADKIFACGLRWTVGIISPASQYFRGVLDTLRARDPAATRVALFNARTGFGGDVAAGVLAWVAASGLTLTTHRQYSSDLADFRPLLAALHDDPADWFVGVGRVEDDIRLARQLGEVRPPLKAVALVAAAIAEFKQALGDPANGFLAPSQWEPQLNHAVDCGPPAHKFIEGYRRRTDAPLDYPAAQGYVAGVIAQRCVEDAGTLDQAKLRSAAGQLQCRTFYGRYGIDEHSGRQIGHAMLATQWQGGNRNIVWPADSAEASLEYPFRWTARG